MRDDKRSSDDGDFFNQLNLEEWNYYDEPDKSFKIISRNEFEEWLQERKNRSEESPPKNNIWQIDTADCKHIGWINYYNLDTEKKQAFIGICLPDKTV